MQGLASEVRALSEHDKVSTHVIFDDPLETDLSERQYDSIGMVGKEFLQNRTLYQQASFCLSGTKPFTLSVYMGLKVLGVDEERIAFEFFGPRQEITAAAPVT